MRVWFRHLLIVLTQLHNVTSDFACFHCLQSTNLTPASANFCFQSVLFIVVLLVFLRQHSLHLLQQSPRIFLDLLLYLVPRQLLWNAFLGFYYPPSWWRDRPNAISVPLIILIPVFLCILYTIPYYTLFFIRNQLKVDLICVSKIFIQMRLCVVRFLNRNPRFVALK